MIGLYLIVAVPGLGPAVGEVNDEDELDEDEEEAADESEPHPDGAEGAGVGDPEGCDHAADDDEVLDPPEPVLQPRPGVVGGLDVDHEDAHHEEEEGDDQAESVDSHVTNRHVAINL